MKTKNVIRRMMLITLATLIVTFTWASEEKNTAEDTNTPEVEIKFTIDDDKPTGYLSRDPGIDDISNYPEPFSSSTVIEYNLAEAGYVTMVIYYQNRSIEVFARDYQNQGSHRVNFDASNLPPGEYTCVLALDGILRYETMIKKSTFSHKKYLEN